VFFPLGANNNEELEARHCFFPFSLAAKDDDEPSINRHFLMVFPLTVDNHNNELG
jgi:hypothetical protein